MTQIKDTTELDFCDVLFMPKRTTLNSRNEADVIREYKFKYYPHTLKSCGIIILLKEIAYPCVSPGWLAPSRGILLYYSTFPEELQYYRA